MIKRYFMSLLLLTLLIIPFLSHSEDHKINVSTTMRKIISEVRNIRKSFGSEDYYTTAIGFMELAKLFKSLESVKLEKSKKETWSKIHNTIIKESFIAIGACAVEDREIISKSLDKISELQKEGHGLFR